MVVAKKTPLDYVVTISFCSRRAIAFRMDRPDNRPEYTFNAVLTISDFRPSDSASYYCNAQNDMGKDSKDFAVKVKSQTLI